MTNVLLLRTPTSDGEPDAYEAQFTSMGYLATSVPVLETVHVNSEELLHIINTGPASHDVRGVIVTSGRAADAWRRAVQELANTTTGAMGGNWSQLPFYAVGQATANALSNIRSTYPSPLSPVDIRGAAESGTSERLAKFILSDMAERQTRMKLFYLTGDKNRDTLPKLLGDGGIDLVSLKVYETQGSSRFVADLHSVLEAHPQETSYWVVFFAPSAADFTVPMLREVFRLPHKDYRPDSTPKRTAKIAAIGPTTGNHLRDTLSLNVDVVSKKPGPVDLTAAVLEHDRRLSLH